MKQDSMHKKHTLPGQLSSVFFGSRKVALLSSLFGIAIAASLYFSYLQIREAAQIELPAGQAEKINPPSTTTLSAVSREILILNSYHAGLAWSDNELAGIIEVFRKTTPAVSYSVEYLDCKRHPKFEHFEQLKNLFKLKYDHREIPVVMVTDNPALDFALKYRSQLFPRSAIVFCGVNSFKKEMLAGQGNITGLAETLNAFDTVSLALKLHPKTKTVVVVHDYTSTGLATRRDAEEQLKGQFAGVSFRYLEDMTKNELINVLKGLPEESVVLALAYNVFKDGEVSSHENMATMLGTNSPVPVYGVHQERLGYGIVGGCLLSGKFHGADAGQIALKIISGVKASDIPIAMTPPTRIMFDYNQLVHFSIPLKILPRGSVVVNRPISFISSHLYLVVSTLLMIGLLASGIVILGFNIYRREQVEDALRRAKEELEMRVSQRTVELEHANEQLQVELTERENAELRLRASEQAFRAVVENSPDVIVRYDRAGRRVYVNPEFERVNNLTSQQVLGKKPVELSTELAPQAEVFTEKLMAAMESGTISKIDLSWIKEGKTICWYVRVVPEFDAAGTVVGALTIWCDISERKQLETILRQSEERFKEAQRIARIGSWELDLVTNHLIWSDEIYRIFEIDPEQFGASYEDFLERIHPDDRASVHAAYTDSVENQTPYSIEHRLLLPDAGIKYVREQCETYYDAAGKALRSCGTVQDITMLKLAEEEILQLNAGLEMHVKERTLELQESQQALMNIVDDLNQKTAELETANSKLLELDRLKSMFIASMSHELRTPLNSIIGFSSIIRDEWLGPVNPEQKENLGTILRSGKHLLRLINDVIDVSKIEAGRIEVRLEEFDLYDLMTEAVQYVEKDLGDKGLNLRFSIVHHPLCTDKGRLLQCVINLLSNAVKYTEHGEISVLASLTNNRQGGEEQAAVAQVEISVIDTGIGIAQEEISNLFMPFVRLESPLKCVAPGTGLGLYLTRKLIVQVLHGDIVCSSEADKGSTFTITIPERI